MFGIILHQDDERRIIDFQKEVINSLNNEQNIFYSQFPLIIPLPKSEKSDFTQLTKIKQSIKSVLINNIIIEEKCIFFEFKIISFQDEFLVTIPIVKSYSGKIPIDFDISVFSKKINKKINIFRIVEYSVQKNQINVEDEIWKKI